MNAKLATRLWSWRDDTRARWDVLLLVLVEIVWKLSCQGFTPPLFLAHLDEESLSLADEIREFAFSDN